MFNPNSFTSIYQEPSWQADEDAIVGKMLRGLLSFEGKPLIKDTLRDMESIIEFAANMAGDIGARRDYVRNIGHRLHINGKSFCEQNIR